MHHMSLTWDVNAPPFDGIRLSSSALLHDLLQSECQPEAPEVRVRNGTMKSVPVEPVMRVED